MAQHFRVADESDSSPAWLQALYGKEKIIEDRLAVYRRHFRLHECVKQYLFCEIASWRLELSRNAKSQ